MSLSKSQVISPAQLLLQYLLAVGQLLNEDEPSHRPDEPSSRSADGFTGDRAHTYASAGSPG